MRIFGAQCDLNLIELENSSSLIEVYFLYRSDMDLDAIKQAVLNMFKNGSLCVIKVVANIGIKELSLIRLWIINRINKMNFRKFFWYDLQEKFWVFSLSWQRLLRGISSIFYSSTSPIFSPCKGGGGSNPARLIA